MFTCGNTQRMVRIHPVLEAEARLQRICFVESQVQKMQSRIQRKFFTKLPIKLCIRLDQPGASIAINDIRFGNSCFKIIQALLKNIANTCNESVSYTHLRAHETG